MFVDFEIQLPSGSHSFRFIMVVDADVKRFEISTRGDLKIADGRDLINFSSFFEQLHPLMYFVDGFFLERNLFTRP